MTANKYKCSNQIWKEFSPQAKTVFNSVYRDTIKAQSSITHPKTTKLPKNQWETIVHNMSCLAAWAVDGGEVKIE